MELRQAYLSTIRAFNGGWDAIAAALGMSRDALENRMVFSESNGNGGKRIDPVYCTDDYPRDGCTIVVELMKDRWAMKVYAPGFAPVGHVGMIETYFPRPYGSLGIAVEAFVRSDADLRQAMPAMEKAERVYRDSSSSGSSVTE